MAPECRKQNQKPQETQNTICDSKGGEDGV